MFGTHKYVTEKNNKETSDLLQLHTKNQALEVIDQVLLDVY